MTFTITRAAVAALAAAAVGAAVAACGSAAVSPSARPAGAAAGAAPVSMATSIATTADSWAVLPMAADPTFWEVFARTGNSGRWQLVTPPGVADNGGLVASAGAAGSLTVAVRPSQDLSFSPLAQTADGGTTWSTGGPINAAVAATPDALAAAGGNLVALLGNGTIEASADAGASWSVLAKPGAIAASPAARACGGAVRVTAISFGVASGEVLAGGTCGTSGTTAVFDYSPASGWQRLSLPVPGQLVRLTDGLALVRGKSGLSALWRGFGWYAYAPLADGSPLPALQPSQAAWAQSGPLPASGAITASGTLDFGGAWVLLPGGRAATVSLTSPQWRWLPAVPAGTSVLASGPDGAVDALAVSGSTATVWRLALKATAWTKVQAISVPIQYNSSS
jgi:hypothetical protein